MKKRHHQGTEKLASKKIMNRTRANNLKIQKRNYDNASKELQLTVDISTELMKLGTRMKQIRQSKNISIRKLAKKANISTKTIWKIENGKFVNIESILRMANILNCQIEINSTHSKEF